MNKEMMEFWGNFLLNASQGQKQLEKMAEWSSQAFKSFAEISNALQKLSEPEPFKSAPPDYLQMWSQMGETFQKSFLEGCSQMWGISVVSDEHLHLINKYEELKEKIASQEETIGHLRLLLKEAKREAFAQAVLRQREAQAEVDEQLGGQQSN